MKFGTKVSIAAAAALTIGVVTPIAAIPANVKNSEVHILSFNDLHGAAAGYGDSIYASHLSMPSFKDPGVIRMAKVINDVVEAHPGSIVLSGGDNNSGNAFSTSNHAEHLYPLLKAMDVRYSAVGNHAFEWGLNYMSDRVFDSWARTDKTQDNYFLAANILNDSQYQGKDTNYEVWKEQRVDWADPYKIVDLNGHNICLIGLATKLTKTDGNTQAIKDLSFINYNASINYTKQYIIDTLGQDEFDKIDAFILLTHLGSSMEGGQYSDEAFDLAINQITSPIDAIISAHSHKEVCARVRNKKTGEYIWVGQASTAARAVLDMTLKFDDTRAAGSKLTSISMQLKHPTVDTAGVDLNNKELSAADKQKALEAATKQYNDLLAYGASLSTDHMFARLVDEYKKQRANVVFKLDSAINDTLVENDITYDVLRACHLGHEYYGAKTINEPLGAWANKAHIIGTDKIRAKEYPDAPTPSISLNNIDSLTHEIKKGKKITLFDVYQTHTYENPIYQGVLTVGQLANIIDYMLSGGLISQTAPYVKDAESAFLYGADNREYDKIDQMETDPITKDTIKLPTLKDPKGRQTKLRYLCGPIQFYGFKFEVEKLATPEKTKDWKNIRQYKLAWENGLPKIWIYDPTTAEGHGNIDNIDSWKQVGNGADQWSPDRLIPISVTSFIYGGGNYQCTMLKEYMQYNANKYKDSKEAQVYYYPAHFGRDALLEYVSTYTPGKYKLSLPDGIIDKFVIYK